MPEIFSPEKITIGFEGRMVNIPWREGSGTGEVQTVRQTSYICERPDGLPS